MSASQASGNCVSKKLMLPILLCTPLNLLCSCAYAVKIHGLVDAERMIKNLSFMLTIAHVLGGVAAPPYCMCTMQFIFYNYI